MTLQTFGERATVFGLSCEFASSREDCFFTLVRAILLSYRIMTSKDMRVNARLARDHASKFNYIRQRTNQGASDIMKAAINLYYEKLHRESPVKPLQLLRESGLIGCAEGDSDLSVNYKQYLTESLNEKYSYC